jgi:quinol monooxygenase YgiN
MAGVVLIPWYATLFRGDSLDKALGEIAPLALRYGATDYHIYRSRDDPYRFMHFSTFENKADFERYWYGEEFAEWRSDFSSWYQVPILYSWQDRVHAGGLHPTETV